jgi:4-amino-4-deoxy-L-arabinose transferase-like glycosyltransferase
VVFGAASALGPFGPRLVAAVCATALVGAGAWAARSVRGAQAAAWTAWTACALVSSPMLATYQLNGEIIAAPLVLLAAAAALHAVYRSDSATGRLLLGVLAGAAASAAMLVKQNFVDGLAFVGVLLAAAVLLRRARVSNVLATGAGFLVGAAVPLAAAVWWAGTRGGVRALVYATYGFRRAASDVVTDGSWHASEVRLFRLLVLAFASGLVLLATQVLVSQRRALLSRSPLVWAVTAAAGLELLGVALGVNYWPHYLIGLVPMVVLATGLACRSSAPGHRWTRLVVLVAVATTMVAAPIGAVAVHAYRSPPYLVGRWIAAGARTDDTVVVPFSHPNVIEASGLTSPYPYSWSLPVRTLDPGLVLLTKTLDRRRDAPTWVVRWDRPQAWGLDPRDRVGHALAAHYRQVAVVCGHPVWLHRGLHRSVAPVPRSCP